MIPKVIHYIWIGGNPLPKIAKKCIESWKKFCPDYKIKRWDETNLDINKYQFAKDAYAAKKFAFVSDVFRTEILYNEGGIYVDIDVEFLKNIEETIGNYDCVIGFETSNLINPGVFIATKPQNKDLLEILEIYKNTKFDVNNLMKLTVCEMFTSHYENQGLKRENKTQQIGQTKIYSSEYFSPIDIVTNKKHITKNTHSIHLYNSSWYTPKQKVLNTFKRILNRLTFGLAGKLYFKMKAKRR